MYRTRLVLTCSAIAALIATSGCDPQPSSDDSTNPPAAAAPSAAPASKATTAATKDATTAQACDDLKADLKDNARKVAKAEKIGPPAGHIAVSAQWIAASAAVTAHSIGADDAVGAAAAKVQAEMAELSEAYNKSADAKPSKKKLEAAIKELNAACAGS
jgi:hypothetical protein